MKIVLLNLTSFPEGDAREYIDEHTSENVLPWVVKDLDEPVKIIEV